MLERFGITLEARREKVAEAHAAGVRVLAGDDAGISYGKRHGIFAEAIIDLALGGVPVPAALATATTGSADGCGVGDTKGRLRAGFDADLLVVDGDLAADVAALRSVAMVFVGGTAAVDRRR
jgi:imidazolonepropionase-like amidohydrolase